MDGELRPSGMIGDEWDKDTHPLEPNVEYGPDKETGELPERARYVDVGDGHQVYVQEYGNPQGEPIIMLHGGPGGGCDTIYARFFDPKRYRIILFDQRGCGHCKPTMKGTREEYEAAQYKNNTGALVEDIETIRNTLGIKGKAHISGGSWGTTLALAYAIKHPENVKSLAMRGVFLGHEKGITFLFQGNAANYDPAPKPITDTSTPEEIKGFLRHFDAHSSRLEGAYRSFMGPEKSPDLDGQIPHKYWSQMPHMKETYARAWDEFVRVIPKLERTNMVDAYFARLDAKVDENLRGTGKYDPKTHTIDPDYQMRAAIAFAQWEGTVSRFNHEVKDGKIDLGKFVDPKFCLIFARMEATYMKNGLYLSEDGSAVPRGSDYLVRPENLKRMADYKIPMFITHGANDVVCHPRDAIELKQKYEAQGGPEVSLTMPEKTGHSMVERGNVLALVDIHNRLPAFSKADWEVQPKGQVAAVDASRAGDPNQRG